MTDLPVDELFPQEGSVRPVTVEPKKSAGTLSMAEEQRAETVPFSGSDNNSQNPALTTASSRRPEPSFEDSFAARIAKVQRQTVDIKQQLGKINFTDQ